ncbi:MAG: hypothetical protein AAFX62_10850, partial [Pseudomonadota bacterium]
MAVSLSFAPLLPWLAIAVLGAVAAAFVVFAAWRGLVGWWLRALGLALLVLALAGPQLREETREGLESVAYLVVDRSESTGLEDRASQIAEAEAAISEAVRSLSTPEAPLRLEVVEAAPDEDGNRGTQLLTSLDEAQARTAPEQIAGAILLTDGQVHDADR